MSTVEYLLAAILGVVLAYVCIMGWRRLIPCFLIGFCLANAPQAALAQYYSFDPDADVPAINEVRDAIMEADYQNQSYLSSIQSIMYYLDQDNDYDSLQQIDASLNSLLSNMQTTLDSFPYYLDSDNDVPVLGEIKEAINNLYTTLDSDNDVPVLNDIKLILNTISGTSSDIEEELSSLTDVIEQAFSPGTVEVTPEEGDLEEVPAQPGLVPNDAQPPEDPPDMVGDVEEKLGGNAYNDEFKDKFKPENFVILPTDNAPLPTAGSYELGGGGMFSITADIAGPMVDLFNTHAPTIRTILTTIICASIFLSAVNTSWIMYSS